MFAGLDGRSCPRYTAHRYIVLRYTASRTHNVLLDSSLLWCHNLLL